MALWAAVDGAGYVLNGPRWPVRDVPYYVNPANLDVAPTAADAAVRAGADAWRLQSRATITLFHAGATSGSTASYNGRNEVFFRNATNGSAIATAYTWWSGDTLLDADIVFWDGAFTFFTGTSGCTGGFYIEDIAAHEFGHALGLGHSADTTATMYYAVAYCSQHPRTLAADDVAGIEALYPPIGPLPPAAPRNLRVITGSGGLD